MKIRVRFGFLAVGILGFFFPDLVATVLAGKIIKELRTP